jgi:hypothetical protein
MINAAHFRKMHTHRSLQKARQNLPRKQAKTSKEAHGILAYRQNLPNPQAACFAMFACWHGRCCAISVRKWLELHLAIALATLGTGNAMQYAKRGKSP